MERLGDDLLHFIFNKLPKDNKQSSTQLSKDRKSFFQVSKQFMKPACFGLRSFTGTSVPDLLFDILPSSPNLKTLLCSKPLTNAHLKLLARSCPKLENLYLNVFSQQGFDVDFDDDGLCALGDSCTQLKYVNLRRRLHVRGAGFVSLLNSSKNLTGLYLEGCIRVTDESLKAIGKSSIQMLIVRGCCLITDFGLEYLASGDLKNSLKELNLTGCDRISDNGVIHLKRMAGLTDLNLSKCGVHLTDTGIVALVSQLPNIEYLDLSWLVNVTDFSLLAIGSKCLKLIHIHLNGCEAITAYGLRAFFGHQTLRSLKLFSCYNFTWEDVKSVAMTCRRLDSLGLMKRINSLMSDGYQRYLRTEHNNCFIHWIADNDTVFW